MGQPSHQRGQAVHTRLKWTPLKSLPSEKQFRTRNPRSVSSSPSSLGEQPPLLRQRIWSAAHVPWTTLCASKKSLRSVAKCCNKGSTKKWSARKVSLATCVKHWSTSTKLSQNVERSRHPTGAPSTQQDHRILSSLGPNQRTSLLSKTT